MTCKRYLWALACSLVLSSNLAWAAHPQQRDVHLDPNVEIHPVTVVGQPGTGTNVRFPDSFEKKNVVCGGQCIVLAAGQSAEAAAAKMVEEDPRNWIMEINEEARLISLRPKDLPSTLDNPASAFTTNLYVKLDGGHVVNLTLRLIALRDGETQTDGVVNLLLPASESLQGKLKAKTAEIEAAYQERLTEGVSKRFAELLGQGTHCRPIKWLAKAHRTDGVVVFVREVCSTQGDGRLFWVVFDVENRSNRGVRLAKADLRAVNNAETERIVHQHHFFNPEPLFFGDGNRGVATAALLPKAHAGASGAPLLNKWELTVETTSGDLMVVEDLMF